jgi:hypothetical protein
VVWPWRYLDDWKASKQTSPAAEVTTWKADRPTACSEAEAEPTAADS